MQNPHRYIPVGIGNGNFPGGNQYYTNHQIAVQPWACFSQMKIVIDLFLDLSSWNPSISSFFECPSSKRPRASCTDLAYAQKKFCTSFTTHTFGCIIKVKCVWVLMCSVSYTFHSWCRLFSKALSIGDTWEEMQWSSKQYGSFPEVAISIPQHVKVWHQFSATYITNPNLKSENETLNQRRIIQNLVIKLSKLECNHLSRLHFFSLHQF